MTVTTITALASAAVATGAAAIAAYTARGASVRAAYELARTLYNDLTSQETTASRSTLEFYRRADRCTPEKATEAMDDYFRLLWQFEKIHAGRQSLIRQRRLNGTGPAVKFLDEMIEWHVSEWAARWIDIRTKLKSDRGEEVDDAHSLNLFCRLAGDFPRARDDVAAIRAEVPGARSGHS